MSDFHLYNTMTRSVDRFAPADGTTVRMYTCGPTVYNPAHVGNFRTFLFEDLLRRTIRLRGWGVQQIMNLTDVDDKIIKRASEKKMTIAEVTEPVIATFHEDRRYLRIEDAETYPRATEHIPEMIALVQSLMEKGIAYKAEDGSVYYAIGRFAGYGKLSRLDAREIKSGARVAQDDYTKENAQDFALWKAAKPEDEETAASWESPWGRGRPGWHLECSAMAMRYLGVTMDIHCGGVDLVFPHHEDEIAQSEGATGETFSRVWCHGEFLLTDGTKMAKRVGNVATVSDMREQGISAAAFRAFVFSTHYRKQLNLSAEALEAATEGVRRVGEFADRLAAATGGTPRMAEIAADADRAVSEALFEDLNAPLAMGVLFTLIRQVNYELDQGGVDNAGLEAVRAAFARINGVLDVIPDKQSAAGDDEIETLLAHRKQARQDRDFAKSDAIRKDLEERGIEIKDGPSGTTWKRVR